MFEYSENKVIKIMECTLLPFVTFKNVSWEDNILQLMRRMNFKDLLVDTCFSLYKRHFVLNC